LRESLVRCVRAASVRAALRAIAIRTVKKITSATSAVDTSAAAVTARRFRLTNLPAR